MEVKEKRLKGRPKKYFSTDKVYEWIDETEFTRAKQQFNVWQEAYTTCKVLTGSEFETLEDYEKDLRNRHPELDKLDIRQLYILEGRDRTDFEKAFRDLKAVSKPSIDKETYTVRIPVERAEEYARYLSIANNFNDLRVDDNTINVMLLPQITNNKIVFNVRSGKVEPNAFLFTQDYK